LTPVTTSNYIRSGDLHGQEASPSFSVHLFGKFMFMPHKKILLKYAVAQSNRICGHDFLKFQA